MNANKHTSFLAIFLLAMSAIAQNPDLPVRITRKDLIEIKKIHTVAVIDGSMGTHPAPDVDRQLNTDFFGAIIKQIETLTCLKVTFRLPPLSKRTPGDGYAVLVTYVDEEPAPDAKRIYYNVSVGNMGRTFWDGGKVTYVPTAGPYSMPQSAAVETLKALAKDACPGSEHK